jgi:hypothetical protein
MGGKSIGARQPHNTASQLLHLPGNLLSDAGSPYLFIFNYMKNSFGISYQFPFFWGGGELQIENLNKIMNKQKNKRNNNMFTTEFIMLYIIIIRLNNEL